MSSSNVTISSDIQQEINTINSFVIALARWFYPTIFVVGVISNILNICVFTRPLLKQNPCCMYFLSSSLAALIYTLLNVPLRTLQRGYNIDPTAYSLVFCQNKFYFIYTWRGLAIWFLALACFDRFLHSSSNANLRKWSSYKVALRVTPLAFILVHLAYAHVPIFYQIILPRRVCSIGNSSYALFLGIWHLITYGTGPPLLMLIFSIFTIQHVRHRRVMPVRNSAEGNNSNSNRDKHLLRMALVQCLVVGSTTTAYAIGQWYATLTPNQGLSNLQSAKNDLITSVTGSVSAAGHDITFFVFTLTSKLFREQLFCSRRQRV